MNEKHTRFLELAREFETLSAKFEEVKGLLEREMRSLDYDYMCQDPTTGVVYKIVKPRGRFVHYADIDYVRTAMEIETRGSLSKKEATEAGFNPGKP